jgi:parafibromin
MSDPLSLVRLATQKGLQVLERNEEYHFGTRSYHIKTETCFRRTLNTAKAQYYTLKDVIFYIQNSGVDIKEYRRAVIKERCVAVVEADKGPLMSYLKGEVENVSQMDPEKAAEVVAAADKQLKESSSSSKSSSSTKEKKSKPAKGASEGTGRDDMDVVKSSTDAAVDDERAEAKKRMLFFDKEGNDMRTVSDGFHMESSQEIKRSKQELTASRKGECGVSDRASVMRNAKVDFSFALKSFNDHVLKKLDSKNKKPDSSSSKSASKVLPAMKQVLKPIIIVPSALSGVINSTNARDMLGYCNFIPLEEAKVRGMQRVTSQTITRKIPGSNIELEYKVIDNPNKLAASDWEAVVAIFATGQLWQFKGWKWEDPRPLFANILGVHLSFDDTAVSENILQWNCKVLKINRTQRHSDAIAMTKFWNFVDSFVEQNRPDMHKMIEKQLGQ